MQPPGFVDLHSHVLPDLDDGPATLEAAEAMCRQASRTGTTLLVATPHANRRFRFDRQAAEQRRVELERRLGASLRLALGSEVEMSLEALSAALEAPQSYTLNGSRYLLVEPLTMGLGPPLERVGARILERGLTPILAHPERNAPLPGWIERLRAWQEIGGLFQITAGALTGQQGERIQRCGWRLLAWGMAHFVASDAHDPMRRPARLADAYLACAEALGRARADALFVHNPVAVVEDRPLGTARVLQGVGAR